VVRSGLGWAAHDEQQVAGVEEGGGGGVRGSGCARQREGREMGFVPSAGASWAEEERERSRHERGTRRR
jgi:hypothetical protein